MWFPSLTLFTIAVSFCSACLLCCFILLHFFSSYTLLRAASVRAASTAHHAHLPHAAAARAHARLPRSAAAPPAFVQLAGDAQAFGALILPARGS